MFKKQEGITLVALVITIIVLLILAGVSISLVVGNNGVLTQASNAVNTNNIATAKQDVQMAVAGAYATFMGEWANNTAMKFNGDYLTEARLENNETNDNATWAQTSKQTDAASTYTYTAGNGTNLVLTFTVDLQGKVTFTAGTISAGSGTINLTADQLK